MRRPFMLIALRLADRNWRLQRENTRLTRNLGLAMATVRKRTDERDQARRDVEMLCLMTKDPAVAAEFVAWEHDIDQMREAG